MELRLEELYTNLKEREVFIRFMKIDGEQRLIRATLEEGKLPETKRKNLAENKKPVKEDILTVFDVEKNDWRSMRKEFIIEWYAVSGDV